MNKNTQVTPKGLLKTIAFILVILIGIIALGKSIYTVDAGETAIVTRYGEIVDQKTSGLNFVSPIEDVTFFSTREAKIDVGEFDKNGDVISGLSAYTSDRQTVMVALTLTYQITNPTEVYTRYKSTRNMVDTLINPKVRQQLEIVFSKYNSVNVIERRGEFATILRQEISKVFENYPLQINDVQAVFNFSKEYEALIEQSVNQDVIVRNKERATKVAIEEGRAQVETAKAAAAVKLAEAEAIAKQKTLIADSEAHAIRVKGQAEAENVRLMADALAKNNDLVALKAVEKWQGTFPTYLPQGAILPINIPGIMNQVPVQK